MSHHANNRRPIVSRPLAAVLSFCCVAIPMIWQSPMPALASGAATSADGSVDLGPLAGDQPVSFALTLPLRNQAELADTLGHIYTKGDPQYHHFLTSEEFNAEFAPTQSQYQALIAFANGHGLSIQGTHTGRTVLDVVGRADSVGNLLGVNFERKQTADGRAFHEPSNTPSTFAALSGVGAQAVGLSTRPAARDQLVSNGVTTEATGEAGGTGPGGTYAPTDIRTAYQVSSLSETGAGQKIALFELSTADYTDASSTYPTYFSLPAPTLNLVNVDGGTTDYSGADEVILDIDMVEIIAPDMSSIDVYTAPNSSEGVVDCYTAIADADADKTVSTSWGSPEGNTSTIAAEETEFEQMAAQGQSIFAAAGDQGAYEDAELAVLDPASDPYVTGVGGTSLTINTGGTWASETTWNDLAAHDRFIAGGGGISSVWAIPSYQANVQFQGAAGQYSTAMRNLPDVSLNADVWPGYAVYLDANDAPSAGGSSAAWYQIGGTSAATPLWASFTSLVDEELSSLSDSPLGFANPALYDLGESVQSTAYHDIADGSNNFYYLAVTGFDDATGWGSFQAPAVLADLTSAASPTVPPGANNDSYAFQENTALNVSAPGVLANDTDIYSDPLTALKVTNPAHGSLTFNANGSFTYTPNSGFVGSDSFTYQDEDSDHTSLKSNVATVTVALGPSVATAASASPSPVPAGQTSTNLSVLGAYAGTGGQGSLIYTWAVTSGTASAVTFSANGSNAAQDTTATFTQAGTYTFTVTITGAYESTTSSVTVTVTQIANNDSYANVENTVLNVAAPGVLANDSDAAGHTLTPVLVASPSGGGLTLNSDGSFAYTPNTGYTGVDTFTYQAKDTTTGALSNVATVTIATEDLTPVYTFTGGSDGDSPQAPLIQGSDGNFYGTTVGGGSFGNYGVAFKMTPAGVITNLHSFDITDGEFPYGALVQGSDGNFYGTTGAGGSDSAGTVFKVTPAGVFTSLHSFVVTDGEAPYGGLVQGSDGNFYGTTSVGGADNDGTVFKITPAGVLTTLHSFTGSPDGANPYDSLVLGSDGNFYGTTYGGGLAQIEYGTVFKITSAGVLTILHSFEGSDGASPLAGVTQASDGNFYGTAAGGGGPYNNGTVFKMTPAGVLSTMHSFIGPEGYSPQGGVIQGSDGNFYGTCLGGGTDNYGTVFMMNPAGLLTNLHSFIGSDGWNPNTGLVQASNGNFYGTAKATTPGSPGPGDVYEMVYSPATPTGLAATAGTALVTLNWHAANGATSYNLYRSTASGGEGTTAYKTGITTSAYTDTGLTAGTTYYYKLAGVNSTGRSAQTLEVSGTPSGAPPTPTGLAATAGNAQVTLNWNASAGATSYNLYRSTTSGGEGTTAYKSALTATSYTDTGLTNGKAYYYTVAAANSAGTSPQSGQVNATPNAGVYINCGGPAVSPFIADTDFSGGGTIDHANTINTTGVTNPAPVAVYQSGRDGNFTYTIPGFTGGSGHTVRLHFCETYFNAAGDRTFNVSINGTQVLTDFDIWKTAGAENTAVIEQFMENANSSGQYVIVFTSVVNNSLVSGIEIH